MKVLTEYEVRLQLWMRLHLGVLIRYLDIEVREIKKYKHFFKLFT